MKGHKKSEWLTRFFINKHDKFRNLFGTPYHLLNKFFLILIDFQKID